MLAIWSLVPLPFLNPTCTSGSSRFTYCWSLAGRILSITLLACELSAIAWQFEHSLALPFFGTGTKTDLFPFCGHFWVFQICWYIECSIFTASSFGIWNSSTGIPSPPLALFIVMLFKTHITSHSKMSGSGWVITPSWFSGSLRYFVYSSSVHSCHLFLISYASIRFISFLSFIVPIFAWNVPLMFLIFLNRLLVFAILLFSSISLHYSLKNGFLALLVILWNSAFRWVCLSLSPLPFTSLLFSATCKTSSYHYFAFLHFFFLGMVLITTSCTMLQTSIHSSSGTLFHLIPWIYLSFPVYNHKGFNLGHTWMA